MNQKERNTMLRYWVWLAQAAFIGPMKIARLFECFDTPETIYHADESALALAGLTERETASLQNKDLSEAKHIVEACYDRHIGILTLHDVGYPAALREIADPPPVLYYVGRLPELSRKATLGVVGARKASAYGQTTAKRLGYQIARCGGVVVTGLARGVDSLAAEGALSGEGPVVGVLGCGVDVVYPRENRYLYRDVCRGGCVLSEYPPGTQPFAGNFPRRNRLISGMSDGVIVVEAGEKSGALITAEHALEQGRDVFAVPGNIDNPACAGSNRLLRDGAIAVTCGWEAVQEYRHRYPDTITEFRGGTQIAVEELPKVASDVMLPSEDAPPAKKQPIDVAPLQEKLSEAEFTVLQALTAGERQLDALIAETGLPASKALSSITLLEVKGYIQRLPGKRFALAEE